MNQKLIKAPASSSVRAVRKPSFWQRRKTLLKALIGAVVFSISVVSTILWWNFEVPLISPVSSFSTISFLQKPTTNNSGKVVYGFLPYWNIKTVNLQPELTHLSYFSLTIGADGSLLTKTEDGTDPGYSKLQSSEFLDISTQARENGTRLELVVSQFEEDDIGAFLSSTEAQKKFISSLDNVLLAYPFSGVNVDIECSGESCSSYRRSLSDFIANLRQHLDDKYNRVGLSIDMYAGAAKKEQIWDVAAIAPNVDHIVVMAYDFHRKGSPQAGPVAPLFGGEEHWDSDISSHLAAFLKVVPSEKILLGVPFYGYEWQTVSREPQSHTYPETGATASIERVAELLEQRQELAVEEQWNEAALSPFLSYTKDDQTYMIYYENSRSMSYKLDFVNQLDLGGVAIWALGYEGRSRELWDVVEQKL